MKPIYWIILVIVILAGAFGIVVYVENQKRREAEKLQAAKEGRTQYIVGESKSVIASIIKLFSSEGSLFDRE